MLVPVPDFKSVVTARMHSEVGSIPMPSRHTKNPPRYKPRGFLLPDNNISSYFLWHFAQFAASFTLNALVPLWQAPQFLPAFMSFIVRTSAPFFIWKSLGFE